MQTLSSASRTCMASASAVEWTATVGMPRSLEARKMRSAISPRLAMRIFSNMAAIRPYRTPSPVVGEGWGGGSGNDATEVPHSTTPTPDPSPQGGGEKKEVASLDNHQRLAEFHRLGVLEQDLGDRAGLGRGNLVERLHRFDDQQRIAGLDHGAHVAEWLGAGLGGPIGGADHRRGDDARVLGRIERAGRHRDRNRGGLLRS